MGVASPVGAGALAGELHAVGALPLHHLAQPKVCDLGLVAAAARSKEDVA